MMKQLLSVLTLITLWTFTSSIYAQNSHPNRCKSDHVMEAIYKANPQYRLEIKKGRKQAMTAPTGAFKNGAVVTIPVHVIIVHPPGQSVGSGDNVSVARIQSQINVLTQDFRRTNSDANNTPSVFPVADTQIEFCLASVDPNGNATNGITRYATNSNFEQNESQIKGATGWSRANYLNIWVASTIDGLGYAYLPSPNSLPDATLDGVVVLTGTFGGPNQATLSPYNLGRTATHEVGHALGLGHIWGNGCGTDDGINDTPSQDQENYGCPNHPSPSCSNGGDMFMNYMDYVDDNCMNSFSIGQGTYMQQILNTSRSSLLNSAATACNGNPVEPSCTDGIKNGSETGVDCGGNCAPCSAEPSCTDGIKNGTETGVDCGGNCPPCETGGGDCVANVPNGLNQNCVTSIQAVDPYCCESEWDETCEEAYNACVDGLGASCSDDIKNGDETGVDCGGSSCPPCETGGGDCVTNVPTGLNQNCVTSIQAVDPFCCEFEWDEICEEAYNACNNNGGGGETNCLASLPNNVTDAACIAEIQAFDEFCCEEWDNICQETYDECVGSGGGTANNCSVTAPTGTNDANCIAIVQANDAYCCDTDWDYLCQTAYDDCAGVDGASANDCDNTDRSWVNNINNSKAKVNWNEVEESSKYQLRYRIYGSTSAWLSKSTTKTNKMIKALQPSTMYEYQVKTECGDGWTAFGEMYSFETEGMNRTSSPTTLTEVRKATATLYPNPAQNHVFVQIAGADVGTASVTVFDLFGRQVGDIRLLSTTNRGRLELGDFGLKDGQYIVKIDLGEKTITKKLLILGSK